MLDSVIGIIFIFLLLSLICTALNELLENFIKNRAKDLEQGIFELLQSNEKNKLLELFYSHPLIRSLYKGSYSPGSSRLPSYIPASNFALTLLDLLKPATETNYSGTTGGGTVTTSVLNLGKDLKDLRESINLFPDLTIKQALLAIIDASESDMNKVRRNLEDWYNTSMDRVSGWYKRRVQKILIVMGFLLALAVNADTIAIYKSLQNDPPLRNSLVTAAQEFAKTNSDKDSSAEIRIDRNLHKLEMFDLPMGWNWSDSVRFIKINRSKIIKNKAGKKDSTINYIDYQPLSFGNGPLAVPPPNHFSLWLLKILGWLITALAISLGAPFWFDTLNKIMVVRSTVKPHEKSPEEASQDKQNKNT